MSLWSWLFRRKSAPVIALPPVSPPLDDSFAIPPLAPPRRAPAASPGYLTPPRATLALVKPSAPAAPPPVAPHAPARKVKRDDIAGKRFGHLVAVRLSKRKRGGTHWICLCDCGNRTVGRRDNLIGGHKKTCGKKGCPHLARFYAKNAESLRRAPVAVVEIGATYGRLTVTDKHPHVGSLYICRCACGRIRSVSGQDLVTGAMIKCGTVCDRPSVRAAHAAAVANGGES